MQADQLTWPPEHGSKQLDDLACWGCLSGSEHATRCHMAGGLIRQDSWAAQSISHPGMLTPDTIMAPAQRPNHLLQVG